MGQTHPGRRYSVTWMNVHYHCFSALSSIYVPNLRNILDLIEIHQRSGGQRYPVPPKICSHSKARPSKEKSHSKDYSRMAPQGRSRAIRTPRGERPHATSVKAPLLLLSASALQRAREESATTSFRETSLHAWQRRIRNRTRSREGAERERERLVRAIRGRRRKKKREPIHTRVYEDVDERETRTITAPRSQVIIK